GAFLVVELASLLIGINLTRTITRAVHGLYTGTQTVMRGDFSHRIPVSGGDQLAELGHSFNRMSENLARLLEVAREKERLQSELEIAREVQNQLFPRAVPELRSVRLKAMCKPARLVSGDYYDYLALPDSRVAVAVGDVAGKGISAALLMATVQSTVRAQLRTACEQAGGGGAGSSSCGFSTAGLVHRLNQHLYAYTPPEKFATFFLGVYDDATGTLIYTNAGHPPPVLVRGDRALRLEINGIVVGAFPSATYSESVLRLEAGDLLVCFTDGVTEPENEYGEMFGEQRLVELLLKHSLAEPEQILAAVETAVREWTQSVELQDDMTLLVLRKL
ncbi:MAG: PP2C family protein-serine/threonine phosphatase, partial [Bryobacteraceae bacterium]